MTTKKPKKAEPQRHPWLDGWLASAGPGLKRLVEETGRSVALHEQHTNARIRARRSVDHANHLRGIEAVTCNLAHAVLMPTVTGRIAVRLGHGGNGRSRYDSPIFGKTLSPLLNLLAALDILTIQIPSVSRGEVTSIAPSPWFAEKVSEFGVVVSDFGRHQDDEVILLSRNSRSRTGWTQAGLGALSREAIDYDDTPLTRKYRADVRALNDFLSGAAIDFLNDGLEPRIDPLERTMRRRFIVRPGQDVRFNQGGRLYGGFWQNLKRERRRNIRIGGEAVAVLDYGSMFTRLAYAEVNAITADGDLYEIPGAKGFRSGVKMAMNTFLFDAGVRRSWPSAIGVGVGNDADAVAKPDGAAALYHGRLPNDWTVKKAKEAILSVHPSLKEAWGRQLGYSLMFKESEILIAVLQQLSSINVPALGLHDGLLVAESKGEEAAAVMRATAMKMSGSDIPVTVEGS
jgi:hypothetical protein